jgi:hypothetical protein
MLVEELVAGRDAPIERLREPEARCSSVAGCGVVGKLVVLVLSGTSTYELNGIDYR